MSRLDGHVAAGSATNLTNIARNNSNTASPSAHSRHNSALIRAQSRGDAKIFGIFGGQGNNKEYFNELRDLYAAKQPVVQDLVQSLSDLLEELCVEEEIVDQYPLGIHVSLWLDEPDSTPSADYLISAPVSFPLIGLLQLVQLKCLLSDLDFTPSDIPTLFNGLTGHSQGIAIAALVSTASTWEEYNTAAQQALRILLWTGARCQQAHLLRPLPSVILEQLENDGYGTASPMLSVANIPLRQLESCIERANDHLNVGDRMSVSLINADSGFVVSGPERTLFGLIKLLNSISSKDSQARVPFSKRKPCPTIRFLPITIPCHSPLLDEAAAVIVEDLKDLNIPSSALNLPVNLTRDGQALGLENTSDITPLLVRRVTSDLVDWTSFAFPSATHIVDFGPGGTSGVGALTLRNLAGMGARVLVVGNNDMASGPEFGPVKELLDDDDSTILRGADWSVHGPALAKTQQGTVMNTKLTRLLGLPPVMVAGMTPTTSHVPLVAAIMKAGFHAELAAGGYHSAQSLRRALYDLRDVMPEGRGITLNIIYVSPRALSWQIPLIRSLRAEGFPLTGLTIGGGVPSLEVATEYITTLGMDHISFKPGSTASIQQVCEIARKHPSFPIILQWTGGRGGGHHSYEDFHAPMLETYAEIRKCNNICLVAGSGFGRAEDVQEYMNGSWSQNAPFRRSMRMPFDGVLVGSRVMTTLEAATSKGAKQAIVNAKGISLKDEKGWDGTYTAPVGGILTVISEMGEPIHVVATRGAMFWSEMDKLVFSLDKSKRQAVLDSKRRYIIRRLNADYQKPWFAGRTDATGQWIAGDLEDMTYLDVLKRLADLMFLSKRGKWIHTSYADIFVDFARRTQERVATEAMAPIVTPGAAVASPREALEMVKSTLPDAAETILALEDTRYFLHLCRRPGAKPVPFVPALDDRFETWFKKDSLWQSENTEAVVDEDADRTFILHGPVAASQTSVADEPVSEVLSGLERGMAACVLRETYSGDQSRIPQKEYLTIRTSQADVPQSRDIEIQDQDGEGLRKLLSDATAGSGWQNALFNTANVCRGRSLVANPIWDVLDAGSFDSLHIEEDKLTFRQMDAVVLQITKEDQNILVELFTHLGGSPLASLVINLLYCPETPYAMIREDEAGRNDRIGDMYQKLWLSSSDTDDLEVKDEPDTNSKSYISTVQLTTSSIKTFNRAIGYQNALGAERIPLDFAIVAAWKPICAALLQPPIQGDLLALVHLSNGYEMEPGVAMLEPEEEITATAAVSSITINDSGKTVAVKCTLHRANGEKVLTITSCFLLRGTYTDSDAAFSKTEGQRYKLTIAGDHELAVLLSKEWFHLRPATVIEDLNGSVLEFDLQALVQQKSNSSLSTIETSGQVYRRSHSNDPVHIATVKHTAVTSKGNIVLDYLSRCGTPLGSDRIPRGGAGPAAAQPILADITIPASNVPYSLASGDTNPIHTSAHFARLAGLPGTITHGMYVSAAVRAALESGVVDNDPSRIRAYEVSFLGMVLPEDELQASFTHESMENGIKYMQISVRRQATDELVLSGSAQVQQPATTVLFTGQGSQEKGMGMDLYETSPVARAIWDEADAYFRRQFGLSILHIVRENPKTLKVHFGGARGRLVRKSYMEMYYETPSVETGELERRPIFPAITETSTSFTHTSPNGLLFATQFAQPALVIMELAAFRDMQSQGVIGRDCNFAGHSLGEYAALAAITDFMPFERLLYIVFCRGMTMQLAVERQANGKSGFGMVAVDPGRVNKKFDEMALRELVSVVNKAGFFIEIVNLNVRESQYVCAGDLRALDMLQVVLDEINAGKSSVDTPCIDMVAAHAASYENRLPSDVTLKRGKATVPLTGVDVPFHSSFLRTRMEAFRRVLLANLEKGGIQPEKLVGKYIPNVTGRPFGISKAHCEEVWDITKSERLRGVLDTWEESGLAPIVNAAA